jgi:tRNA (cytidine/uridine-2'-O-)-methyltransferase
MIHLALYQPDIPQNTGAAIRLCACLGITLDIIEPCGFPWNERKIKQSALDYAAPMIRHRSWNAFLENYHPGRRIIAMTTKAAVPYTSFAFRPDDILLAGQESAGLPPEVHETADARLIIPLAPGARSFNVINAAAIMLGEALRQTGSFSKNI